MVAKLNTETASETSGARPWFDSDEPRTVHFLRSLASRSDDAHRHGKLVERLLRETGSDRVRNAAAIALVDLGLTDAAEALIDVLRRPEIAKASGTLIYALDELGASIPFRILIRLLENGSYEARAQALSFFEDQRIAYSDELERHEGRQVLSALSASGDPEAAEVGYLALGFLEAGDPPSKV